ncbi:MAG TPA: hypothetical protein VHY80_04890 [Stellaceae bacterium]|nr:hypothetical protein [Stellaceae bacterium]
MELPGAAFLYTLATLMVTFAGFSALLLMIRQAAGAQLSPLDRFLTRTVVGNLFVLTAGALLPPLLALYGLADVWIWRASAILFGLPYLAILVTFPHRRRAATGHPTPPFVKATFIGLGAASLLAMIAYVFTDFGHSGAAYITALMLNFLTLALAFVIALEVILAQPVDRK